VRRGQVNASAKCKEVQDVATAMRGPEARPASPWLLAVLLAVVLTACGTPATGGSKSDDGRLYAQCMRANGVPDFPDPGPDGRFPLSHGQSGIDQDSPTFRAAMGKCRALAPGGEHQKTGDPAYVEQLRKFSQCMRDNGLPDFPDPDADGRLRGPGHETQDSPTYQAAMAACRGKLPGGGDHR
jgi:hypothetical protein